MRSTMQAVKLLSLHMFKKRSRIVVIVVVYSACVCTCHHVYLAALWLYCLQFFFLVLLINLASCL
jgi:hypothetical protein